jgi:hypothetical protein
MAMITLKSKANWLAVLALVSAATAVSAVTLQVNQVYVDNFSWKGWSAWIPLNNDGELSMTFRQSDTTPRVLHYSAVCALEGGETSWIDVDIYLNGVVLPATAGDGDALCGNGTYWKPGFSGHNRRTISLAIQPREGDNVIQILGRLDNGATLGVLGEMSLLVY